MRSMVNRWAAVFSVTVTVALCGGCAGLVSGTSNNASPTTLVVSNVQASAITVSGSQIFWTTDAPADSSVDYGTTTAFGNTTPLNSTMVTSHQVTLSGLAAATTYYFQVNSTDAKGHHGHGGNSFNTTGFSVSGTISPATAGSGTTVTLSGPKSATTTPDGSGTYTFSGLPTGSYGVKPSNPGYNFSPASQTVSVGTGNVTAVNFSGSALVVAPTIATQPVSQTVTAGQTATFSVAASGTAPLSYQWQQGGANIAGATASTYTTPATTTSRSGSTFDVVVSNSAGSLTSSAATLTVTAGPVAPTITTQPVSQTVTAGQTATFSVVANGTAPLSYQWQKNGANLAGATGVSYTTPATATTDSGSTFDVVVSNTAGSVTTAAATLTVSAAPVAPTITTQPTNQTVTAGQTATFSVVASGTAPLSYQWQDNGTNIAGATSSSFTTAATAASQSGSKFDVVVTDSAGSTTSSTVTLTVNAAAAPAIQVSSSSMTFGNDVVGISNSLPLTITNTGTATLTITQIAPSASAFSVSGFTLPLSVTAGQQTTITIAFLPAVVGAASGSLSIVSNAPSSPTPVALSGTGVAATFTVGVSPSSLSFGNVTTNTSSAGQDVTLTNTGNSNVTISQITLSGLGYSMTGGSTPVTLSPTQNVVLAVQFSPTATGTVNGSISITSNATGSPATVTLSGTGVAPVQHSATLSWTASTSTVAGYNVYRGMVSGGPYSKINASLITTLTYTDATVQSGTTYYYVATAVDSTGNESVNSVEVSAPIP